MFDIGWSELVVIGIVALIAIGPKELPGVLRSLGQWMGKIRRMASEFQDQFREAMREAEMTDLKKQFDDVTGAATSLTSGFDNPLDSARKEVEKALGEEPASDAVSTAPANSSDAAATPVPAADEVSVADDKPAETKPEEVARSGSSAA